MQGNANKQMPLSFIEKEPVAVYILKSLLNKTGHDEETWGICFKPRVCGMYAV